MITMLGHVQSFVQVVLFGSLAFNVLPLGAAAQGSSLAVASVRRLSALQPFSGSPLERMLFAFQGTSDGREPMADLIADASGALYGTVLQGGGNGGGQQCALSGCGAVFKLTPGRSGYTESVLYGFYGPTHNDGVSPYGSLIRDKSGALYGTTAGGGGGSACSRNGCGTVFKLTPIGAAYAESVLYVFQGGYDGSNPFAGLIADADGALYGTTLWGGDSSACTGGCGTVFKLAPTASGYTESVLHRFQGGNDGGNPYAGLIAVKHGALYGTTSGGGSGCAGGCGTVFKLEPTGSSRLRPAYKERILYAFKGGSDGRGPEASLIADRYGALYGTTAAGGGTVCFFGKGCGTVFKLTPAGSGHAESILYRFAPPSKTSDGYSPQARLIARKDGALYGTTLGGGEPNYHGYGTVFKLTRTASRYTEGVVYTFHGTIDGAYPRAGLIADKHGALYGTTSLGGGPMTCGARSYYGCGIVFKLTP